LVTTQKILVNTNFLKTILRTSTYCYQSPEIDSLLPAIKPHALIPLPLLPVLTNGKGEEEYESENFVLQKPSPLSILQNGRGWPAAG